MGGRALLEKMYLKMRTCAVGKKKGTPPTNSNTNYRRKIKLVPNNKDYCLLQFDAQKFVLGDPSIWGSVSNFVLNVKSQL